MSWTAFIPPVLSAIGGLFGNKSGGDQNKVRRDYERAVEEAQRQNRERYKWGMRAYQNLYGRAMQGFARRSGQAEKDIRKSWANVLASGKQDLVSRGLTGTTIYPNMVAQGAERETADINRSRDALEAERRGVDVGIMGDWTRFVEGVQNPYPNPQGMYAAASSGGQGTDWTQIGGMFGNAMTGLFNTSASPLSRDVPYNPEDYYSNWRLNPRLMSTASGWD